MPNPILAASSSAGGGLSSLVFLALLIVIFYFVLIRPQRRRQQQHRSVVESVTEGAEVVTIGGMYGTVSFVGEQDVQLEIAPDVTIRILKSSIARVLTPEDEVEEEEEQEEDSAEPIEIDRPEEERR